LVSGFPLGSKIKINKKLKLKMKGKRQSNPVGDQDSIFWLFQLFQTASLQTEFLAV